MTVIKFFNTKQRKTVATSFITISEDKRINVAKQSWQLLQRNRFFFVFFVFFCFWWLLFQRGIIASGKLRECKCFQVIVLFLKTRGMSVKKFAFVSHSIFSDFCGKPLRLFKNRSGRARIHQSDIKFVFCIKNWFLRVCYTLKLIDHHFPKTN